MRRRMSITALSGAMNKKIQGKAKKGREEHLEKEKERMQRMLEAIDAGTEPDDPPPGA